MATPTATPKVSTTLTPTLPDHGLGVVPQVTPVPEPTPIDLANVLGVPLLELVQAHQTHEFKAQLAVNPVMQRATAAPPVRVPPVRATAAPRAPATNPAGKNKKMSLVEKLKRAIRLNKIAANKAARNQGNNGATGVWLDAYAASLRSI